MIRLLNLVFALVLYCLALILYRFSYSSEETGLIRRTASILYPSFIQSSLIFLTLWIYVLVSSALWIGWTDSFVQIMLIGIGLMGGLSMILELRRSKEPSTLTDGLDFFISTIEYYYEKRSEGETKEAILGLISEAETNDDAEQALMILLSRDSSLGEITNKLYTDYRLSNMGVVGDETKDD